MDDGDLGGEPGQEGRLLHRGVASPDHRDVLIAEEEAVAGGAGGQAVAHQLDLAVESQHERLGPGGHDHGPSPQGRLRCAGVAGPDAVGLGREVHPGGLHGVDLGTEPDGLLPEPLHQLRAHHALGEAGIVLDVGGEHELAAGLVAGRARLAFEHHRREVGPGRVDGRGEPGRAGADYGYFHRVVGAAVEAHLSRGPSLLVPVGAGGRVKRPRRSHRRRQRLPRWPRPGSGPRTGAWPTRLGLARSPGR